MDIRIQKALLKAAIDLECLLTRIEKECLKLIVDMACSTGELMVVAVFCYWECQRRGWLIAGFQGCR